MQAGQSDPVPQPHRPPSHSALSISPSVNSPFHSLFARANIIGWQWWLVHQPSLDLYWRSGYTYSMTAASSPAPNHTVGAVLFDMDGTITKPYFDFDAIRREIGLPTEPRTPILEAMDEMTPEQRARTETILHRYEEQGARESELQDDAHFVLDTIRSAGIPVGLITRNSRKSVDTVIAKHDLHFDRIHTRENGPVKPAPDAILNMCRHFNVKPTTTWLVGDYLFDLLSGNAAGVTTVLMINEDPEPDYAHHADHVIQRLRQLIPLLGIAR